MMVGFNNKKINSIKTLGERLCEHRQNYGLSVQAIARETKINIIYLQALENDKFDRLPSDIYTKNIIRRYAEYLNLNPETVIDIYNHEKDIFFKTQKKQNKKNKNKQSRIKKTFNVFLNPHFIKYSIIISIVVILMIYIGWGINRIFTPPKLEILQPEKNLITDKRQVHIRGQTEKEVNLTINGQQVISDKQGGFSDRIDLQKGLNIIKITAQKKHSKENVKYLQIIVEENSDLTKND